MLVEFKNIIMSMLPYTPFLSAAVVSSTELNVSSLVSRLLESAIIAAVILYANVEVMGARMTHFDKMIIEIKERDVSVNKRIKDNTKTLNKIFIQLEGLKKDIEYHTKHSKN